MLATPRDSELAPAASPVVHPVTKPRFAVRARIASRKSAVSGSIYAGTGPSLTVGLVRNGRGIVAAKPFRPGATIFEIKGKIIMADAVWGYWKFDRRRAENCFRYDKERYLDPNGEIGQDANHSCNPNGGIIRKGRGLILKAIAPIAAGEEVTHDYSTLLGRDDVWKMRCDCGELNCRRVIGNIGKLPAATMRLTG